jgi:hypothetical protein
MCDGYGELEEAMSKRYSTEKLVNALDYSGIRDDVFFAIIARLRAADKLCEVARKASQSILGGHWGIAHDLDKAIADYEEEK